MGDPEIVERRFFASATVPEVAGLLTAVDLLAEVLEARGALADVLEVVGLSAALGLDALTEVEGFRVVVVLVLVVPRFSASVSDFTGV